MPYSPLSLATAYSVLPTSALHPLHDLYLASNNQVLALSELPTDSAVATLPHKLRSEVHDGYCPSCLASVPVDKLEHTKGCCFSCFVCPDCPTTLKYVPRSGATRRVVLQCPNCGWVTPEDNESVKGIKLAFYQRSDDEELRAHLAVTVAKLREAMTFSTRSVPSSDDGAAAARRAVHPTVVHDEQLAQRQQQLHAQLHGDTDAHLCPGGVRDAQFAARKATAESVKAQLVRDALDGGYVAPQDALPLTQAQLAGIDPALQPSTVFSALQFNNAAVRMSQRGLEYDRDRRDVTPNVGAATALALRQTRPTLVLQRVPLQLRSAVFCVPRSRAHMAGAPSTACFSPATLEVITRPPDAKTGGSYARETLAGTCDGEVSNNAGRWVPTLSVMLLRSPDGGKPCSFLPVPNATRTFTAGLWLTNAAEGTDAYVEDITLVRTSRCTVASSLPTRLSDCVQPEMPDDDKGPGDRVGVRLIMRKLTPKMPATLLLERLVDPAALSKRDHEHNVATGAADTAGQGLPPVLLHRYFRVGFQVRIVDERAHAGQQAQAVWRVTARLNDVPVVYCAALTIDGDLAKAS